MNRRTKKLIFTVSLLLLLCVTYVLIVPLNDSANEDNSSKTETKKGAKLGSFNSDDITDIAFNGISLTLKNNQCEYAADSDYPVDSTVVAALADTLSGLTYSDKIKKSEADDLSVYGFELTDSDASSDNSSDGNSDDNSDRGSDKEGAEQEATNNETVGLEETGKYNNLTLEISFNDGIKEHTYYIGTYNSIVGGYYMTFDNDDYIYLLETDIVSAFDYDSIFDLLVVDTIPEIDAAYVTGMAVVTPETSYIYTAEIISQDSSDTTASDEDNSASDSSDTETTDSDNSTAESSDNNTAETEASDSSSDTETSDNDSTEASSIVWYVQATDIASEITGEKTAVDTDTFSTVVNNILNAVSKKAVSYKPSNEELVSYGLAIPEYTIILTYIDTSDNADDTNNTDSSDTDKADDDSSNQDDRTNADNAVEKTLTISIGSDDENGYSYAIINNSNMVVSISGIDLAELIAE